MHKKILALVMALAVMFAFTGCMSSNNEVTVRADGTADVYVDFSIDKTKMESVTYDVMLEMAKAAAEDGATEDEIKKAAEDNTRDFMDGFEQGLLEDGEFKLEKTGGSEYYTMKENAKDVSIKDARDVFKEYDSKVWLSAKAFNLDLSGILKGLVNDELETAVSNVTFDMSFKATFPYEIIKTNGRLSADKKTVEWSYTGSKKVTKKGKYSVTVTDNMGNKKTVKFTVK